MLLYTCGLTFHDHLFYETRTMGRFYETGRLLHNIALSYALGFAQTPYHHADDVPRYGDELRGLNEAGIYVTPAGGEDVRFVVHTFKLGDEQTAMHMVPRNDNLPSYGRAKEVAVGSRFRFYVLSPAALTFPRWIRMGLWLSKARLDVAAPIALTLLEEQRTATVRVCPLNPADLPETAALTLFDLVAMRPSNLVENAEIAGDQWWTWRDEHDHVQMLPAGLRYRVADVAAAPPKKRGRA